METNSCISCQKTKALLECGACHTHVCKYCAHIMPPDSFSFLEKIPADLSHSIYCAPCFNSKVADELESYNQIMERAKDVQIYLSNQGKETRLIKRLEKPFNVKNCLDHNETMMRLAFFAAKANFNTLVDVKIISEKVRDGAYQTLKWSGSAVPVNMSGRHVVKDRSIWQNPN